MPDLDMIEQFHDECRNGLWTKYDKIIFFLKNGGVVTHEIDAYIKKVPGYLTITSNELIQYIEYDRNRKIMELDLLTVFDYLSFAEGKIRLHIVERMKEKRNTIVSSSLRQLDQTSPEGIGKEPLEKVLEIFKKHGTSVKIIGEFKWALATRHWLAHGRWWTLKSGVPPRPDSMKMRVQKILEVLKILPSGKMTNSP
ncbi:MAG: hypothetical protein HQL65_07360 [Magnetococcales bacterium]|nr:hypothetical protein [Magnetococcales bacterium]